MFELGTVCDDGSSGFCDGSGACVECISSFTCPNGTLCDPSGACVECYGDSTGCSSDRFCEDNVCRVNVALQVSVGTTFSCARDMRGAVFCWGSNSGGQLGTGSGDNADHAGPAPVPLPGPAIDVAAGADRFACAVVLVDEATGETELWCWGANATGNLGAPGLDVDIYAPTFAPVLQLGNPISPSDVELGELFGCVKTAQGPYCWGENASCQAHPSDGTEPITETPQRVLFGGMGANDVLLVGADFGCVSPETGPFGPYCWGANVDGQLGFAPSARFCGVGYSEYEVELVTAHLGRHACGLTGANVVCWGSNTAGQLGVVVGDTGTRPVTVDLADGAVALALGAATTCAQTSSAFGPWSCWGQTIPGFSATTHVPVLQPALDGLRSLSLGSQHGCGINASGYVYCFGDPTRGRTGPEAVGTAPARVVLPR